MHHNFHGIENAADVCSLKKIWITQSIVLLNFLVGVQVNVSVPGTEQWYLTLDRSKLKFCTNGLFCLLTMSWEEIFIMVHFAHRQKILHTGHESLEGTLLYRTVVSNYAQTSYEILIVVSLAWLAKFLTKLCLLCFKMLAYVSAHFLF